MRIRIMILAVLVAAVILTSCTKKEKEVVCKATVVEIEGGGTTMIVTPVEGSEELNSSDKFSVPIQDLSFKPQVGDIIEITYSGYIREIYPAGFDKITKVELVLKAPLKEEPADEVKPEEEPADEPADEPEPVKEPIGEKVSAGGPYGELTVQLPENWSAKVCPMDDGSLMYGLYGLILKPTQENEGSVELIYSDQFAVCGTGLEQETLTLSGVEASMGKYDGSDLWSFIIFKGEKEGVVAQTKGCDSWSEETLNEALSVLDTVEFDPGVTEGGANQFIPEAENTDIGVLMEVTNITPDGAFVCFTQYESNPQELEFGEAFTLLRQEGDAWVELPIVVEGDWCFTEEAYNIPAGGTVDFQTDWSWLYGPLEPGVYRIRKDVQAQVDGKYKQYPLEAQFILTGSAKATAFDISDDKWNWINWDADADGVEEELCFEYEDLGDEAPSCIIVTLYDGNDQIEGYIDRAYGLRQVHAQEDAEGPYLAITYDMGDYYSHEAEGHCTLRLSNGEILIEYEE